MVLVNNIALGFRIVSAVLAIIELGLNAYIVHYADDYFYEDPYGDWKVNHDTPSQIAFLLFASAWSLLALIYVGLVTAYVVTGGQNIAQARRNMKHRYSIAALDVLTMIFWLAGWIALAQLIGGPTSCTSFCAAVQASVAFAAGLWASFAGSGALDLWQVWRGWKSLKDDGISMEATSQA